MYASVQKPSYTPGKGKIVPPNVINVMYITTACRKGLQFWLHSRDRAIMQWYKHNICAETHLDGGVVSPFVSPLSTIARAHNTTVALRKGPWRFCPCRSDRALICAETHPCGNVVNTVIMFYVLAALACSNLINWIGGHHVTCTLIGTSH